MLPGQMAPLRTLPFVSAAVTALLLAAPAAGAVVAQPLVDRPPVTTSFEDRVMAPATARAAGRAAPREAGDALRIPAGDGATVTVAFVGGLERDQAAARSYVAFLDSLPHGSELGRLTVALAPARRVGRLCGGGGDVLACYSPAGETMIVPGEEIGTVDTPTTSYVVAHEYGHHVAANRDNAPFAAIDFGPKRWASYERVCAQAIEGRLAPGDEGGAYRLNPGESWAEVYARLRYPDLPWRFAARLEPDEGALAAARRDVLDPWTAPQTRTFTLPAREDARSFRLPLRLDGKLRARVQGEAGSEVGLTISADGELEGRTRGRASRRGLTFAAACRERDTERLTFAVTRDAGRGPVSLRVSYAG